MIKDYFQIYLMSLALCSALFANPVNKVAIELRDTGRFRVSFQYTLPELKELRQAFVEFASKKEADAFYFHLLRGGEVFIPKGTAILQNPKEPEPW